jgi:hypothetical protein
LPTRQFAGWQNSSYGENHKADTNPCLHPTSCQFEADQTMLPTTHAQPARAIAPAGFADKEVLQPTAPAQGFDRMRPAIGSTTNVAVHFWTVETTASESSRRIRNELASIASPLIDPQSIGISQCWSAGYWRSSGGRWI